MPSNEEVTLERALGALDLPVRRANESGARGGSTDHEAIAWRSERRTRATRDPREVVRLALDPGHGGTDPGAVSAAGLLEKDVASDVVARAVPLLVADGVEVLVTRDEDRALSLAERARRANEFEADLFVSVHCNAYTTKARGIETYVLDLAKEGSPHARSGESRGGAGATTRRMALRENGARADGQGVQSLLASMRVADHTAHATAFAALLQSSAREALHSSYPDVPDRGVHAARLHVLMGAHMPAVLFEMGFVSSAKDERRLRTEDYRQRLAEGLVNAVRAYRGGM